MSAKYIVTKEFIGGVLKGLKITEKTPVKFQVGFVCEKPCGGSSPYRVVAVREAGDNGMRKALSNLQRGDL